MKDLKERMIKYANEKGINYEKLVEKSVYDFNPVFSEEIAIIACEMLGINAEDFEEEYIDKIDSILDSINEELLK